MTIESLFGPGYTWDTIAGGDTSDYYYVSPCRICGALVRMGWNSEEAQLHVNFHQGLLRVVS